MVEINSEIKKIIEENPLAFATVDKENNPNVIAVGFVKVISKNQILITDNYMKKTKNNLENNKNVCLVVWDKDEKGYKLLGKAEYFSEGEFKKRVKEMPENQGLPTKGAIVVNIYDLIELC